MESEKPVLSPQGEKVLQQVAQDSGAAHLCGDTFCKLYEHFEDIGDDLDVYFEF